MYSSLSDHYSAFSLLGAEGGANAQRAQLEETIRKSLETGTVTAGVQTPTTFGSAGQLSPLVNEDLDKLVSQIDFKAQHLAFFAWLPEAKIDGVVTQLKTAGQYENLDGEQLTMELLEERVRDLQAAPNFGMPTHIFVVPKVYTALTKQQIAMARREMNGEGITYGFPNGALKILVGESILSVVPLIFLADRAILPASSAMNNGTAVAVVAINHQPAGTGAPGPRPLFGPP